MRIYIIKIGESVFRIQAHHLYELSEKLKELCKDGIFTLIAIQYPGIRL